MKTKIISISLLLMLSIGTLVTSQKVSASVYVSAQVFYDGLSPYGTWVDCPYGYVWLPDAGSGFVPYSTNGNWVYTNDGWTWVSYYPWGWAPFHYGRWYTDPTYGPVWFPGYEWSPGWVTWRSSNDYYGWAAMEPGISIVTAYGSSYYPRHNYWTAKRNKDFGNENTPNYYFNNSYNGRIINNSAVINNTYIDKSHNNTKYHAGPYKAEVEKHTGKTITPYIIKDKNYPGQNITKNQLYIYRPYVKNNYASAQKPSPSKATDYKDMKTLSQKNTKSPTQKTSELTNQKPFHPKQTNTTINKDAIKQPAQYNTNKKNNSIKQSSQSFSTNKVEGGTYSNTSHKVEGNKQTNSSQHGKK